MKNILIKVVVFVLVTVFLLCIWAFCIGSFKVFEWSEGSRIALSYLVIVFGLLWFIIPIDLDNV